MNIPTFLGSNASINTGEAQQHPGRIFLDFPTHYQAFTLPITHAVGCKVYHLQDSCSYHPNQQPQLSQRSQAARAKSDHQDPLPVIYPVDLQVNFHSVIGAVLNPGTPLVTAPINTVSSVGRMTS